MEFQRAITFAPSDARPRYQLAWTLVECKQYDEAFAEFKKLIQINPRYAPAHLGMGQVYDRIGQRDKAISEYREATRLDPDFGEVYVDLAQKLTENHDLSGAADALRKANTLVPNEPQLYYVYGLYFRVKGDADRAASEFKKAIGMNSTLADHYQLGLLLREKGELEAAVEEFQKAVEIDPDDEASFLNLSAVLRRQGKESEADKAFDSFRKLREHRDIDDRVQRYNDEGILPEDAVTSKLQAAKFRSALDLRPQNLELRRNLAMALFMNGQLSDSRREWETAVRLGPRDWQAYYGLGLVMAARGTWPEASSSLSMPCN